MKIKKYADIFDVARHAGVSPATVSRCFNHPNMVKPDTRKRIEKAIEATSYIRNRAAQAIHGRRSGIIGLIVPTLDNAIFARLIQAFSERLYELGFTMLVATHGYDLDYEHKLVRSLLEHRVEGLGLIGLDHRPQTYDLLESRETPVVAIWNYAADSRISCVGPDNRAVGRKIANYVADLGHGDIALMFPDGADNDRASDRLSGVQDALAKRGIFVPARRLVETKYSLRHAKTAALKLLRSPLRPSAVIAGNDIIARGVLFAALDLGIKIPAELCVCGIGDFSGSSEFYPSLTTIRLPPNQIARNAADILNEQINPVSANKTIRKCIGVQLKIRNSSE